MARIRRDRYGDNATSDYSKGKVTQKFTQTLIVELDKDDPDPITPAEILALRGIPIPGYTTYSPRDGLVVPFAMCKSVAPKPDPKSRRLWRVVAKYELSGTEPGEPQSDELDPNDLAPKVEPFTTDIELPMLKDFDDKVILDPFDQYFDTPVMAKLALPGVRVTRYVDGFDENTLATWKHTTNDEEWRGQPEDTWCIQNVTGQEVQFGNFTLGQLQFEISANTLELAIDGETVRVGWMDARALLSNRYYKDGELHDYRANEGLSISKTFIDKDGNLSPEVDGVRKAQFVAFRNRRQRDFSLIMDA